MAQQVSREVTLGSDPEIAVVNSAGKIIPACGLFGGDKGKPVPVPTGHGGWLEDGIALELNPNPAKTPAEAYANLSYCIDAARKHVAPKNYTLHYPVVEQIFNQVVLAKHPKAVEFGCAVDYSAYQIGVPREGIMQKAMQTHGTGIRFYGGHLHLGVSNWPAALPKFVAIRFFDLLVGAPIAKNYTPYTSTRDNFYGNPGLYRETKYGVEYRTPTNSWLAELGSDYEHSTLGRVYELGQLFANFEKYEEALVRVYNDVNWDDFASAFQNRKWSALQSACAKVIAKDDQYGYDCVEIGDKLFPLWNFYTWGKPDKNAKKAKKKPSIMDGMVNIQRPGPIERAGLVAGDAVPMPDPIENANSRMFNAYREQLRRGHANALTELRLMQQAGLVTQDEYMLGRRELDSEVIRIRDVADDMIVAAREDGLLLRAADWNALRPNPVRINPTVNIQIRVANLI
jgi:hypothetical protein